MAHRDLKLDNTLLTADNPPIIKLCDFGFARGWGEDSHFTTVIGECGHCRPSKHVHTHLFLLRPSSAVSRIEERFTNQKRSCHSRRQWLSLQPSLAFARYCTCRPMRWISACLLSRLPSPPACTSTGTPDYMSPQITAAKVQGKAAYDGTKADVWAMGVLLCVMLIGEGTGARGAGRAAVQGPANRAAVVFRPQQQTAQ